MPERAPTTAGQVPVPTCLGCTQIVEREPWDVNQVFPVGATSPIRPGIGARCAGYLPVALLWVVMPPARDKSTGDQQSRVAQYTSA
jgi:hypothetical protein